MVERGQFQEEAEVESQVTISAETQKDLTDEQRVLGVWWKRNLDLVDFLTGDWWMYWGILEALELWQDLTIVKYLTIVYISSKWKNKLIINSQENQTYSKPNQEN